MVRARSIDSGDCGGVQIQTRRLHLPGDWRSLQVYGNGHGDSSQGSGIKVAAFNAIVEDLVTTLDKLKVAEKERANC
jgi:hypothetical protein